MSWQAQLSLRYWHDGAGTRAQHVHEGPLRVLKALYPEGPQCCQHVIVHPPSGLVGGDGLTLSIQLEAGTQALLTTPGATRFYRSEGAWAEQTVQAQLAEGSRLEWLPQETLVYNGALARNRLQFVLAPGAEMIGCDVVALGLPEAGLPFAAGVIEQALQVQVSPPLTGWVERARVSSDDAALLHSPAGLASRGVWGLLWWAQGMALDPARRDQLLEAAREAIAASPLAPYAGATQVQPNVVVVRGLAERAEPLAQLLRAVRSRWRQQAWHAQRGDVRLWAT